MDRAAFVRAGRLTLKPDGTATHYCRTGSNATRRYSQRDPHPNEPTGAARWERSHCCGSGQWAVGRGRVQKEECTRVPNEPTGSPGSNEAIAPDEASGRLQHVTPRCTRL